MGRPDSQRIRNDLRQRISLLENPRQFGHALQGTRLGHLWRYRDGDFRVLCEIRDQRLVILVVEIGHRRDGYR
ncbi:type II toxin-antitoxin system RelE family toxin [Pararhizobium antarcticum]|uniref:type II toxin-antitoxin system RelE family toxin n=1 Tax=Pararhizobium antarcticum TaxID=1798805 RepID=UPI00315B289A